MSDYQLLTEVSAAWTSLPYCWCPLKLVLIRTSLV